MKTMRQYGIFRAVYEAFCEALAEEGERTGLFLMKEGSGRTGYGRGYSVGDLADSPGEAALVRLRLMVCDVCQTEMDKSGQRVIEEEKDYEAPARYAMTLAIRGDSRSWPVLLEAMGCVARFFKDNPSAHIGECAWHGGETEVFLEPVVRQPQAAMGSAEPNLTLYYRTEIALNSEKGRPLRRVQKRELKTLIK